MVVVRRESSRLVVSARSFAAGNYGRALVGDDIAVVAKLFRIGTCTTGFGLLVVWLRERASERKL